jgi:hypothetical protein
VLLEDLKFYINNTLNFSVLLLGWIRERDPSAGAL